MKVTKYLHSCLLVEDQGKVILIDPGNFTYENKALDINSLNQLDYILVTHSHSDHFCVPFIKEIVAKFPNVQIITNEEIVGMLAKENVKAATQNNEFITGRLIPHEKILTFAKVQNTLFDVFGKLSHPGDSLTFDSTKEVLALPIQAPWGSTQWAVETAQQLQPKVIVPIHDYHWKDDVRKTIYSWLKDYFSSIGIEFKAVETGEPIEV